MVWSIAGSDSGGGAGVQADIKALQAFGVHGCSAVAAITAQNSVAVTRMDPVSSELLDAQLAVLAQDMPPHAIKTGLLGSAENVRVVCRWVDRVRADAAAHGWQVPLVVDPVLGSSTGAAFADDAVRQAYVDELLPRATLITPNQTEAQLLGLAQPVAQQTLLAQGASLCITGGDANDAQASDWLHSPQATGWLSLPRVATIHHHGTGCTFASTAAAALASGYCVADAVVLAKMATTHALRHAYAAGQGAGPVNAQPDFAQHIDNLPVFTLPGATAPMNVHALPSFAPLSNPALGVYAVVDSAAWVRRALDAGIRTVQLRIKDPAEPTLAAQIQASIAAAHAVPGAQLFINDHWQLALQHGGYGVHLGQEDLEHVDLQALRQAGIRIGLSTHSYWEVARAWALRPSYIACGPIFATQSKDMPWIPQGLNNLRYWANVLPLPVVGIAGIDASNVADVAATGAASAAVISAITKAISPEQACAALLQGFAGGTTRPA
ncbi:bifunctional hydroxymethylpyrimidine kinase/phosphomethylpyrimidine kinase [Rhodoferax sp.]|uniref:bifunctional hydroxymethylpyrimidine kinase/phosphomethylpyrimidine kinase n=1 Tax=Rhodoferax sp. TaxID=50421 RepID=UPI002ACEF3B2|nr:bifunctional hydroxymethylpyrimidine kinase/phosphomethylpyrimidine kinase [Rhodoferax sp.]MDZ7919402.1 bifunctional hydroxymethylpyrimidine kinase/phosphomethylpyrimidine kinase [Rhodoferax sp.]